MGGSMPKVVSKRAVWLVARLSYATIPKHIHDPAGMFPAILIGIAVGEKCDSRQFRISLVQVNPVGIIIGANINNVRRPLRP